VHRIDGRTLWANIHLLLWLSLTPLATSWLGQAGVEPGPTAAYAIVQLGCAVAYTILTRSLLASHETDSALATAIGSDRKGRLSLGLYTVALTCSFFAPWASVALFVAVALIWFIPDRRVEHVLLGK
jgi:uncharacterized membrane protein